MTQHNPDNANAAGKPLTQQRLVDQVIHTYWPLDKMLIRLAEEVGELCRAFRKETRQRQEQELGDVIFTCVCIANREGINIDAAFNDALLRAKEKSKEPR